MGGSVGDEGGREGGEREKRVNKGPSGLMAMLHSCLAGSFDSSVAILAQALHCVTGLVCRNDGLCNICQLGRPANRMGHGGCVGMGSASGAIVSSSHGWLSETNAAVVSLDFECLH